LSERPSQESELIRLRAERAEADRRYNEALTEVDRALQIAPALPDAPPPYDEHQITPLNRLWNIVPAEGPTPAPGWRGRLGLAIWRVVAPPLQRQQEFNAALVDHLNRNVATHRALHQSLTATLQIMRDALEGLQIFEHRLVVYLQRITALVETKDREVAGAMPALAAAIGALSEEMLKHWESLEARERRYEARVGRIEAAHDDLRGVVSAAQKTSMALNRQVERILRCLEGIERSSEPLGTQHDGTTERPRSFTGGDSSGLHDHKYVGFEDHFRGSQAEIRTRLGDYVPRFTGSRNVLDVGCGRGEFLELLREAGIPARGVDINAEMVDVCRARGLDVQQADAVTALEALADGAIGGLFAAQVVEHLEPAYLVRMLEVAHRKLRPGSRIVLETINPSCWFAFFESYLRDITHVRPLHHETLQYFLVSSGFQKVAIEFRAPYPPHEKLQPVSAPSIVATASTTAVEIEAMVETLNANVERLNQLMFTYLDYAAIGEKL